MHDRSMGKGKINKAALALNDLIDVINTELLDPAWGKTGKAKGLPNQPRKIVETIAKIMPELYRRIPHQTKQSKTIDHSDDSNGFPLKGGDR